MFEVIAYDTFLLINRVIVIKASSIQDAEAKITKFFPHCRIIEVINVKSATK